MAGDVVIPFEERPLPDFNFRTTLDLLAPPTGLAEGIIVAGKELFRMVEVVGCTATTSTQLTSW